MATFSHTSGVSVSADGEEPTWSHTSGVSVSADGSESTWSQSFQEVAAAWKSTEMMQFGFLFWNGIDYNWEDEMAYTDTYAASQQTELSGKWEELG